MDSSTGASRQSFDSLNGMYSGISPSGRAEPTTILRLWTALTMYDFPEELGPNTADTFSSPEPTPSVLRTPDSSSLRDDATMLNVLLSRNGP